MLTPLEVGEWDATQRIKEDKLAALDVVPLCIKIVSYAQPPKHIWANRTYLQLAGQTLEAFLAQDASPSSDACSAVYAARYQHCQVEKKKLMEPADSVPEGRPRDRDNGVENMCVPVTLQYSSGEVDQGVMITKWPAQVKRNLENSNRYMRKLLECSPYPLCLFNFNGHLITCNPAAVAVFGNTIWLQSDIFGMSERERCGLDPNQLKNHSDSFQIERTERCTAYEAMMEALVEDGSSYQTDLMIRRRGGSGAEEFWYCRVFAQRHKDPITGEPLIMISHQDVTELRKVEGELGRMEMSANTKHDLMKHDTDVAGSLMVLLGEDWNFLDDPVSGGEGLVSTDGKSETLTPRSMESTVSADSVNIGQRPAQLHGLRACLDRADEWQFNVFDLEKESDGLPLQVLCWHLFMKHNLIEEFQLDQIKLINFLRTIENGHQDNPYHNATHVADVMQSMQYVPLSPPARRPAPAHRHAPVWGLCCRRFASCCCLPVCGSLLIEHGA
jgi:PAS domain-containing protein